MKVLLTAEAESDIKEIKEYLLRKWGWKVFENFLAEKERVLNNIKSGIITHMSYEDTPFRKVLITEHNTMIYHIEKNVIYVIAILNNYKDPDTNYKKINTAI